MKLNITAETRKIWEQTLAQLNGQARRLFMASVIVGLGRGGAAWAKRELGWDRTTVKKGLCELNSGVVCIDNVRLRGRKGFSLKLPQLKADLQAIGEASSQTDPTFRTTQLYRRLTAAEAKLTPFGIHRPDTAETWLRFTTGNATADFMVDRLSEIWPTLKKTVILHIPS